MRVLLFQSWLGRDGLADQLVFPIGLSCIASALERAGHSPWIVDLNVGGDPFARIRQEIRRFEPGCIGVSLRNIDSTTKKAPFVYHTALAPILAAIRAEAPGTPTVLGGPGFTQSSRAFMQRYPFDYGVQAEGEDSFVELLANLTNPAAVRGVHWRDETGSVHYTGDPGMPGFEDLPFPKRHFLDWDLYRTEERSRGLRLDIGIETTRGCPRKCAYCNYPLLNGVKLRRKPPNVVVEEIEYLQSRFAIPKFTFTDSRFNENIKHATAVCEEMIARKVRIEWTAWLGFRRCDQSFLELMREAGCTRVAFSPDGLLQPSLDRMRKEVRSEEVMATVRAVRRVPGLRASWSFFATPPSTSTKEQLALLGAYAFIHASMPGRGRMLLNWCRVEERTQFEAIAREDGVFDEHADLLPNDPAELEKLFYVPPGFGGWSTFWDRLLDAEMGARVAVSRATQPLRSRGFRDLRPEALRVAPNMA